MDIASVQNSDTQAAASTSTSDSSSLDKEDFLKLLVSQLQNQDPTNPLDDKEFIAQLAQFSSLEQAMETNTQLAALQTAQTTANNAQLASLVGKNVVISSSSIQLDGTSTVTPLAVNLGAASTKTTIEIVDATGTVVRTVNAGAQAAGQQSIAWDGRDDNGKLLEAGNYSITIDAKDSSGTAVTATNEISGTVEGVAFDSGSTELIVDSMRVKPADIIAITN